MINTFFTHFKRLALALLMLLLVAACGGNAASVTTPAATITPLPGAATAQPSAPTSTPVPTVAPIADMPELQEAQEKMAANNFEQAVSVLNRVYAAHRDDPNVQQRLASAYLVWGQTLLTSAAGDPAQVSKALDKFTSGLAVAPATGAERTKLQAETTLATNFVDATATSKKLDALIAAKDDRNQQVELAGSLMALLDQMFEQRADYPGLQALYVQGMSSVGQAYLAAAGGGDATTLLPQALAACARVLNVDPQNKAALDCQKRAMPTPTAAPAPPTKVPVATKVPVVTKVPRPKRLAIGKINSDDAPGCISIQLRGVATAGWSITIDGLHLGGSFDGGGNARVCGLPDNAITFTIRNGGGPVPGGSAPARGGDIFVGRWG